MSTFSSGPNPYDSPREVQSAPAYGSNVQSAQVVSTKRPTFCTVMFILDIIFCGLRLPLLFFGVLQVMELGHGRQAPGGFPESLVWAEVLTTGAICMFGLFADWLLLENSRKGILLAWLAVAATAGSFIVGIMEGVIIGEHKQGPEAVGHLIGLTLAVGFRIGFAAMYVAALTKFSAWKPMLNSDEPWGPQQGF